MNALNVLLPENLTAYVHERVVTDGYGDASEYIRELIRADKRERAMRELEAELAKGVNSGPAEPVTPEMWESLRRSIGVAPE